MSFTYPTYSVIEYDGDTLTLDGTEGRMLTTFCEIYNCSFEVYDDGNFWGTLNSTNGTAEGKFGYPSLNSEIHGLRLVSRR